MKGFFGVVVSRGPGGLNGRAEGRPLTGGEADGRHAEDIGAELAPEGTLGAASGDADLGRVHTECPEAVESVGEAEGYPLHCGACEVGGCEVLHGDAVEDAASTREIGSAFAGEVGEEQESVATGGHRCGRLIVLVVAPALEELAGEFGDQGHVHRAGQGHPGSGAVAEGRHLSFRIDDRGGTESVERARGAEARGHDALTHIAGADGTHHVIAAS